MKTNIIITSAIAAMTAMLAVSSVAASADPDKLEHAISNLLTNALKYARTKNGISCGNGRICIENDCAEI